MSVPPEAVTAIAAIRSQATVLHLQSMRVAGSLHGMHVLATAMLTWVECHAKRGKEAFDAFAILPKFLGTLIHDGWKPYRELLCKHGLRNAHHLRDLTYVFEELGQAWAGRMIDLLVATCHKVNELGGPLFARRISNPLAPKSGERGRTLQSKAANLLLRLRNYADDVWRFATDHNVPFTNNTAAQAVRMPKVQQKISGCFRTKNGADTFCTIRSYRHHAQAGRQFLPCPYPDFPRPTSSASLRGNFTAGST